MELYELAKRGFFDFLLQQVCDSGENPRYAETWLYALTNRVESTDVEENGAVYRKVVWRRPLLSRWTAPRYLRSPEAAMQLVIKVAKDTPYMLTPNDVARKALAKVAKGDAIFWGHNASRHIAQSIVVEMLRQLEEMKGN